jgi:GntR family transcriptional repressor for pyruvate dehydrogenase complex
MQELFGVSRATVREAIRVLEATGLVSVRHGQAGAVLNPVESHLVRAPLSLILQTKGVTNEEIWELRVVVETATARWAAERATDEQIEALQKLVAETADLSSTVEDGVGMWPELHQKDVDLHSLIAEASRNRLSRLMVTTIRQLVYEAIVSGFDVLSPAESTSRRKKMVQDHMCIVQAIAERKPAKAERLMKEHLDEFRTII